MKKHSLFWLITVLLAVLLVMTLGLYVFSGALNNIVEKQKATELEDTAQHVAEIISIKLQDSLKTIRSVAAITNLFDTTAKESQIPPMLSGLIQQSDFSRLLHIQPSGLAYDENGRTINLSDQDFFKKAETGEAEISTMKMPDNHEQNAFVISAPVFKDGQFLGCLAGIYVSEDFTKLINISIINGQGSYGIFHAKGDYIIKLEQKGQISPYNTINANLDSLHFTNNNEREKITEDLENGESGTIAFIDQGSNMLASYRPLGINDLYVITVSSENNLLMPLTALVTYLHYGVMVVILIAGFYFIYKKKSNMAKLAESNFRLKEANDKLALSEERYRMALAYTNQMVYEYDISAGIIRRSVGDQRDYDLMPVYDNVPESFIGLCHLSPESAQAIRSMYQQIHEGKPFNSIVVQLPRKDGSYIWSKISYITIFDDQGKPVKAVEIIEDIDQIKREEYVLREKAMRDIATGLYNKSTTQSLIDDILQRYKTYKRSHALLLLDIDNFKDVNDTYGHVVGDIFLEIVADKLKRVVRKTDIVGRMGGDEFAVFLQNLENSSVAEVKAMEILNLLRQPLTDQQVIATVSIGIALCPEHGTTFSELYLHADKAMYRAKEKNKNTYIIYSL